MGRREGQEVQAIIYRSLSVKNRAESELSVHSDCGKGSMFTLEDQTLEHANKNIFQEVSR